LHAYHDAKKTFPPGLQRSWYVDLLPYVEQQDNDGTNPVTIFVCPSRRRAKANYADYAGFQPAVVQDVTATRSTFGYPIYTPRKMGTRNGRDQWILKYSYYSYSFDIGKYSLSWSVLGTKDGMEINHIKDGTSTTAVLTDKWVNHKEYEGFRSDGDVGFNQLGGTTTAYAHTIQPNPRYSPSSSSWYSGTFRSSTYGRAPYTTYYNFPSEMMDKTIYYRYEYLTSSTDYKLIEDRSNPLFELSYNTLRSGTTFYRDSQTNAANKDKPGSAHTGGYQPVAFADGTVRTLNTLPGGSIYVNDGN